MNKQSNFLRLKLASSAKDGVFGGYAAVYGNVDSHGDMIAPGAFAKSLAAYETAGTMPVMLWGHDPARPIGKWLEMQEDDLGLFVRGQCNLQTSAGRDAHAHLSNGDVTGMSIGYRIPPGGAQQDEGVLILSEIDLKEVSVVAMPSNERARITSKADLANLLIKTGLPRAAAAKIAAGGFPALSTQTEDTGDETLKAIAGVVTASLSQWSKR